MKQPHNISTCTTTQKSPQFHKECSKGTHNCSTKLLTSDGCFHYLYEYMLENTGSKSQHHLQFLPPHCPIYLSLSSSTPSFQVQLTSPMLYFPYLSSSPLILHESHCHQGNFCAFKTSNFQFILFIENR